MDVAQPYNRSPLLRLARRAWWPLAIAMLGLALAALPGYVRAVQSNTFLEVRLAVPAPWGLVANAAGAGFSVAGAGLSLALAGLLFWRRSDDPMALFVSAFLLLYAVCMCGPLENLTWLWPGAMVWAFNTAQPLFFTVPVMALVALFPNGRLVPRWAPLLVAASLALAVVALLLPPGWVNGIQSPLVITYEVGLVACSLAGLYAQIYRYRYVSTPTERHQVRWVVYSMCLWAGLLLPIGASWLYLLGLPASAPVPPWSPALGLLWNVALVVLPVSLTVAVLRYRLYAIDRVLRRTLIFTVLTGTLTVVYLSAVGVLQALFRSLTGQSSPLAIVVSTLVIAALFAPLRRRIQNFIDRRLFRTHYDVSVALAEFGAALRDDAAGDLTLLAGRLEAVVDQTMHPASVWLWLAPRSEPRREG